MKKNKICTSAEQSKKLIELGIDVNSADFHWFNGVIMLSFDKVAKEQYDKTNYEYVPAWSLSALLELIPNYQIQTQDSGIGILYGCKETIKIIEGETPIDAAFEMVCWLLKNKKL